MLSKPSKIFSLMQSKKLRIAFFGDDFSRRGRGTALVIQKIVKQLVEHHSDTVEVVLLRPAGACRSPVCGRVQHVIIPRRFSTLLSYLWFFVTHRERYDTVVFNRVLYPGFFLFRVKKRIVILHDASISEIYVVPRTPVNHLFEFFIRLQRSFVDIAIGVSNDASKHIQSYFGFAENKTRTLYLSAGDEYRIFSDSEKETASRMLKEKFGINRPYVLDVSRFDPHKNIERVLDAFSIVKNKGQPHSLVLVGGAHTAGYSSMIEEKIRASRFRDEIQVLDYVEEIDMPALYACADMLLYPSLVEGFGLPILEAMKSGTPVVTSNISCLPEIAGGAALLVDPLIPREIAEGVTRIINDKSLRASLVKAGHTRAADFSWGKSADVFMGLVSSTFQQR